MSTTATTGSDSALEGEGNASIAARAKTAASGAAQLAADKIDDGRASAAEGLDSAASSIHRKADDLPGGESVRGAAHATANALSSTADYIRENDVKDMLDDAQKLVRNNPGFALLAAGFLGFLIARSFSRD